MKGGAYYLHDLLAAFVDEVEASDVPLMRLVSDNRSWKDVDEVLPDDRKRVIVNRRDKAGYEKSMEAIMIDGIWMFYDNSGLRQAEDGNYLFITHWMPLPKPPE
jgi:hypothetical protein